MMQFDNASTHRAHQCSELIRNCNLISIKAPPYSPDLNPIEVKFISILLKTQFILILELLTGKQLIGYHRPFFKRLRV